MIELVIADEDKVVEFVALMSYQLFVYAVRKYVILLVIINYNR